MNKIGQLLIDYSQYSPLFHEHDRQGLAIQQEGHSILFFLLAGKDEVLLL